MDNHAGLSAKAHAPILPAGTVGMASAMTPKSEMCPTCGRRRYGDRCEGLTVTCEELLRRSADVRAGNYLTHEEAMAWVDKELEKFRAGRT